MANMMTPNIENYTKREKSALPPLEWLFGSRPVRSLLNVGMNMKFSKKRGINPHNSWWQLICESNSVESTILEVWEPNVVSLQQAGVANVVQGDVRNVEEIFEVNFDVILWWHGPEHMDKEAAKIVFKSLEKKADHLVLLGCPLGKESQGSAYGNPNERHLSAWNTDDFLDLDYSYKTVMKDYKGRSHITAWKGFD